MSMARPPAAARQRVGGSARRAAGFGGCSQVAWTRYPDAAFERLEAHAHGFGASDCLRAAGDLSVGEIGSKQIHKGGARLAGVRRRQCVREDACVNIVASPRATHDPALESIQYDQDRAQCVVGDIAGAARVAHEPQMQQAPPHRGLRHAGIMQEFRAGRRPSAWPRARLDNCPARPQFP